MNRSIKINKGISLKLSGEPRLVYSEVKPVAKVGYVLSDFYGITPKMLVKENDEVKIGSPLFCSKDNMDIVFTSNVSGKVLGIKRGAKRKILSVIVSNDKKDDRIDFKLKKGINYSLDKVKELLLNSGLWPCIKQRPYDVIANPKDTPRDIFISCFRSAPLSGDPNFILNGKEQEFKKGLQILSKFTKNKINISVDGNSKKDKYPNFIDESIIGEYANVYKVSGKHPYGNVGVQINKIAPINKGDIVWTISPEDVVRIGYFFISGKIETYKIISLGGYAVKSPMYLKIPIGSFVGKIFEDNLGYMDNIRVISGNVFTGRKLDRDDYLGFYNNEITVVEEGNKHDLFGWILPSIKKFSISRANYFSWIFKNKRYSLTTNMNGEERPFLVTGHYEKVFPMDIYPMQLMKSILYEDLEEMENLGIYEVIPEDFSVVEFVCPSKINCQAIIRRGLDLMMKE